MRRYPLRDQTSEAPYGWGRDLGSGKKRSSKKPGSGYYAAGKAGVQVVSLPLVQVTLNPRRKADRRMATTLPACAGLIVVTPAPSWKGSGRVVFMQNPLGKARR